MPTPSSQTLGVTKYQLYCVLAASIASVNFGWSMGATNLTGDYISKCISGSRHLIRGLPSCIPSSDFVWGFAVGSFALGALFGAFACTKYSNKYGRKSVLVYANIFSLVAAIILGLAVNIAMMIIGRVLVGIAVGAANGTFATYVTEITTPRARNSLSVMTQLAIIFGIAAVQLCSLGMLQPPLWRVLFSFCGVLSLANIAALYFCVESPRWLIMNGQEERAQKALCLLRKGSDCTDEFNHMIDAARKEMSSSSCTASVIDVIRGKTPDNLRHQLFVSPMLMVFQQVSGISGVSFYSTTLFNSVVSNEKSSHLQSPTMAQILTCILTIVGTLVTLGGMVLSMHFGRRTLIMLSHFIMAISSIFISVGSIKDIGPLAASMVFVYFAAFFIGSGPCPWSVPGEMTPTYAIAAITAISGSINYLLIFVIGLIFSSLLSALNGYTFLLFAVANFIAVAFMYVFLPETKDQRLADMVEIHSVGIHSVLGSKFKIPPKELVD